MIFTSCTVALVLSTVTAPTDLPNNVYINKSEVLAAINESQVESIKLDNFAIELPAFSLKNTLVQTTSSAKRPLEIKHPIAIADE
ncbi:MAG: hypothetical protein WA981_13025 [Glaciecola sp.]